MKALKRLLPMLACLALAVPALAQQAAAPAAGEPAAAEQKKPDWGKNVGDLIKPMTLKPAVGGSGEIKTRELKKDTLFVMVNSVCSECRRELGDIGGNINSFKAKNVDVVLVLVDVAPEAGLKRLEAMNMPVISDPEYSMGAEVDLTVTPATLLVGKDGRIKAKQTGYGKEDYKKYLQ